MTPSKTYRLRVLVSVAALALASSLVAPPTGRLLLAESAASCEAAGSRTLSLPLTLAQAYATTASALLRLDLAGPLLVSLAGEEPPQAGDTADAGIETGRDDGASPPAADHAEDHSADHAEDGSAPGPRAPWSLRGGIGFTLDPDTFLLTLEAAYDVVPSLRMGPLLQFGVSDHRVILAPSFNVQYVFDLSPLDEDLEKLKPFVQGGVGFAYFHRDNRPGDDDDVGFLINFGFGLEYYLMDNFALGTNLLFNVLPVDALGDHFFFSWQLVTATFRF